MIEEREKRKKTGDGRMRKELKEEEKEKSEGK